MQQFCPKCGKETDSLLGPRGLCSDCFNETADLIDLPDEITFSQCTHCGNYRVHNTWNEFESDQQLVFDLLKPHEKEEIEMSASFRKKGEKYIVNVLMEDIVDGKHIQQTHEIELIPEKTQCRKCANFHGGAYDAIVQIRGTMTEAMFGTMMDKASDFTNKDRSHYIANVEEQDGGYDIYTSTTTMANKLIDILRENFTVDITKSRELVGEHDGQEQYRLVISARVGEQLHD
jgi:NMD protein affecting ribosome stability and mRNA decay